MDPIKITGTMGAYLPDWVKPQTLFDAVKKGEQQRVINILCISVTDMSKAKEPWPLVGTVDVTITMQPENSVVAGKLAALQAELDNARAEWLTRQQQILDQINNLQALPNEVQVLDAEAQS